MKYFVLTFAVFILSACTSASSDTEEKQEASTNTEAQKQKAPEVESVKIVEFFDYGCGYCRKAHFIVKNLKAKYDTKIEVTEKHFPLSPQTFLVAETAECARDQDKFYEYHSALFEKNFGNYDPENLQKVAEGVGIDLKKFNLCVVNGVGKTRVQEDVNYAESLGVKGTPFFLLNESIPLSGAVPEKSFDRLIQQVLDGEIS